MNPDTWRVALWHADESLHETSTRKLWAAPSALHILRWEMGGSRIDIRKHQATPKLNKVSREAMMAKKQASPAFDFSSIQPDLGIPFQSAV